MTTFTHVRELTELPDGTDLQVRTGHGTPTVLQVRGGVIYKGTRVIDPWFLEGHVAEGTVIIADLRPLENGEWVTQITSSRYVYLVLRRGTDRNGGHNDTTRVAYFRETGAYAGVGEVPFGPSVFDNYKRCEAPSWSTPELIDMTRRFEETDTSLARLRREQENLGSVRNNLRYAVDYIQSAQQYLGERR